MYPADEILALQMPQFEPVVISPSREWWQSWADFARSSLIYWSKVLEISERELGRIDAEKGGRPDV